MAPKQRPELKKGARVVARTALRGVPEGTKGRVIVVNGFAWIRYWVRWENGVYLGSIDRALLATPDEWERRHEEAAEEAATAKPAAEVATAAEAEASAKATEGGDAPSAAASRIPAHLLNRSKAAKAKKAG